MNDVIERIDAGNVKYDICIIERRGMRQLSIRYHPLKRVFHLSAPPKVKKARIEHFIEKYRIDLSRYAATIPEAVPLQHNAWIPIMGQYHEIVATAKNITAEPHFLVPATSAKCSAMCRKLLEQLLRERLEIALALAMSSEALRHLDIKPVITLRDPVSRWASCASDGRMMFSWRLIFAPLMVINYVAMHEAAHLIHRNHSADFWQLTRSLCRDTDKAMLWLKEYGKELFRYVA